MTARETFWTWLAKQDSPRVLEIGTRAWGNNPPRHHKGEVLRVCPSAQWLGVDVQAGEGVDIVADAHRLADTLCTYHYHAIVCVSTLEHLARPWVAAASMATVIRSGGLIWCETHQTYPVHGYPSDFFRFTTEGLREVFSQDAGWEPLEADYSYPAKIMPPPEVDPASWNFAAEAWLNVGITARRRQL